ncbi:MAG: DMT family transporter [Gammaproteobacteria bacterium]|nr:DMT family transporter [Gammaproteobacteria bacterium]
MSKTAQMVVLLAILVLIWGVSWPVMAEGLKFCPPIWFVVIRLAIAITVIFGVFACTKQLVMPIKKDIPLLLSIGLLQIGFFTLLITVGLEYVAPGRSAIIAYLSPFFVTPIALVFFKEVLSNGKILGLILGAIGIALLFSPWELDWHDKNVLLGNGLLLLSALVWSAAMIHTRYTEWHRETHELLPWQFVVGFIPNIIIALIWMPHPVIQWSAPMLWFSLLYNAILASLVAYWLLVTITRHLPVITTSLGLLGVPVLGLLASALFIGEPLTLSILTSLGFIIAGLACVSVAKN